MKTNQQDLKSNNLSLNEAIGMAHNHPLWRLLGLCLMLCTPSGVLEMMMPRYWCLFVAVLQACVQTNDDNVEKDTQTEETTTRDKWTQHPAGVDVKPFGGLTYLLCFVGGCLDIYAEGDIRRDILSCRESGKNWATEHIILTHQTVMFNNIINISTVIKNDCLLKWKRMFIC